MIFTVGTLLGLTARQMLIRGSLLTREELLVAVRVGEKLWPGSSASPVINYGSSLGPHMRGGEEIGSRSGRESTSN